ncbi:MAG: SurA N-terminal domain-containing protein, partial [Bdellovibrionota bacterium]
MKSFFALLRTVAAMAAIMIVGLGARAETVERIVAIVNDEVITQSDINRYADRLKSGGLTDDLLIPDDATKQALIKDRAKLLQKMIDEKLIDSEVKKQSLSVPIEKVEQQIRTVAKNNGVSRDELKNALAERGIPFSEYQDFIKTGLERQGLVEKSITSRIKISEDDVMAQYVTERGASSEQAFEYTLAHLYFSTSKGGATAAQARANDALGKLKSGTAFEKLAGEVSEDPAFEQGGALGVFKTGELQKELEGSVQKLQAGEHTNVLPTAGGF